VQQGKGLNCLPDRLSFGRGGGGELGGGRGGIAQKMCFKRDNAFFGFGKARGGGGKGGGWIGGLWAGLREEVDVTIYSKHKSSHKVT